MITDVTDSARWEFTDDLPDDLELITTPTPYWDAVDAAISLTPDRVGAYAAGDFTRLCRTPIFTNVIDRAGKHHILRLKVKTLSNGTRIYSWQGSIGRVSGMPQGSKTIKEERLGLPTVKDGWSPRDQTTRSLNYSLQQGNAWRFYADWGLSGSLGTNDPDIMRRMIINKILTYIDALEQVFLSEYVSVYDADQQRAIRAHIETTVRADIRRLQGHVDLKSLTGKLQMYCPEVIVRNDAVKGEPLAFRPGLTTWLADMGHLHTVTTNDMSRLARSVSLMQIISETLKSSDTRYVAFIESSELGKGGMAGEIVTSTLAIIAQHKLFESVVGVIRGTVAMLEAGRCLGGNCVPFWISRDEFGRATRNANLPYLDLLRELVARDGGAYLGWNKIRDIMHDAGLRSRQSIRKAPQESLDGDDAFVIDVGGESDLAAALLAEGALEEEDLQDSQDEKKAISTCLVRNALRSPALYGAAKYCGLEFPGIYPPIMEREEFEALQEQLALRGRKERPGVRKEGRPPAGHLLLGVIECICGRLMGKKPGKRGGVRVPLLCGVASGQQTENNPNHWHPTLYIDDVAPFFHELLSTRGLRQPLLSRLSDRDADAKIRARLGEIETSLATIKEATLTASMQAAHDAMTFLREDGFEEWDPNYAVTLEQQKQVYRTMHLRRLGLPDSKRLEAEHGGLLLQLSMGEQDVSASLEERCAEWDTLTAIEQNEVIRSIFMPLRLKGERGHEYLEVRLKRLDDNLLPPIYLKCRSAGKGKWRRRMPSAAEWIDSMLHRARLVAYEQK